MLQTSALQTRWQQLTEPIFSPPFLRRIDTHLLLTCPALWSWQLHTLAYHTLFLYGVAFLLGWLVPASAPWRIEAHTQVSTFIITILATLLLGVWFHRQSQYAVEYEHGEQTDRNGWREFFGSALVIGLVLAALPIGMFGMRVGVRQATTPRQLRIET